jgi:hypothetical protein
MSENRSTITTKQLANAEFLPHVVALLNEGHTVTLPLRGFSMRPFLEDGRDKALLKKAETVSVGDVILAELYPGHYVLHRIIRIEGDNITLRGDGNLSDEHCRLDHVRAIAIGFFRKGRSRADLTTGRKWRIYSAIWTHLFPIRRYLLFIYRKLPFKL